MENILRCVTGPRTGGRPLSETAALYRCFQSFGIVGVVGFVVDAGALMSLNAVLGLDPFQARAFSIPLAVTVTWALNRRFTFHVAIAPTALEWFRYTLINSVGAILNYTIYAVAILLLNLGRGTPVIALMISAGCAMFVNFKLSRHFVFSRRAPSIDADKSPAVNPMTALAAKKK
jgi:putative flippase GtrA